MEKIQIAINAERGVSDKVMLVPAGQFKGRDGRMFCNDSHDGVLNTFRNDKHYISIDVDHEIELRGGGSAKGWITEITEEQGAIYERLELNDMGDWLVQSKTFRYISPVFYIDVNKNIVKIESVALTNKPNLYLKSLNKQDEVSMKGVIDKEVCTMLGVSEGASVAEVVSKIAVLQRPDKVMNTSTGERMVSKAVYEEAINRAETAERQIAVQNAEVLTTEVNSVIDAAVAEGKVAPANKGYYVEQCSTAEGLAKFKDFVKTAPKVIADDAGVGGITDPNTTTLSAKEKAVCAQMGVSEETFALDKKE